METMNDSPDKATKYISRQESDLGRRRSNVPSLVCAFSASVTTGGTIYAFGIFANDLKKALQLTQLQLGSISAAFFIAGLLSWIPGMVVDRMKMRFSMALGGISGAFFTLVYWSVCRYPPDFIMASSHNAVLFLGLLAVCICMSCGLIVGSIFKLTMLCGGPKGKGPAVGVAKGLVGLGSGVYATIFQAFRADNESALDFLPVISLFFLICATLPALALLPPKSQFHPHLMIMETTDWHFRAMYAMLFVLCLFIVTSALGDILRQQQQQENYDALEDEESDDNTPLGNGRQYGKVLLILFIWLGPIVSLLYIPRREDLSEETRSSVPALHESEALLPMEDSNPPSTYGSNNDTTTTSTTSLQKDHMDTQQSLIQIEDAISIKLTPQVMESWRDLKREEQAAGLLPHQHSLLPEKDPQNTVVDFRVDLSLPQMLQTPSAWLMLWTTLILIGSGTTKTNNMGEMVESLQLQEAVTPATLALFSVAQAAARILTGISSEVALQRFSLPRPVFLVVASVVMLLAHLLLATSVGTGLVGFVVGCTISAIAFGMAWPLMVLIVGDVFGTEHHGANYMFFDGGTKALGTIFLSQYVAGTVYEAHVGGEDVGGDGLTCLGVQCFRQTNLVIAGLSLTCVVSSLMLCWTTKRVYLNNK